MNGLGALVQHPAYSSDQVSKRILDVRFCYIFAIASWMRMIPLERGCRSDRQLQNTPVGDALGFVRIINRFPRRCDKIAISLRTSIRIELRAVNPQWVHCFASRVRVEGSAL